jgi:hypothetical protein
MPSLNHVHTYVRWKTSRTGVVYFRCTHSNCTHFAELSFLPGKLNSCISCGEQFTLTKEDLRRAKPKCLQCSNTKKAKIAQGARRIMESLTQDDLIEGL